ncbi:PREDICTED: histidine triad nucleotide-binding protein 3-like [Gekko japonicus]|uniref:Adenosine 5'-monophosphoramidase HINT3 n=1 Tax=Gekko japonicus TaxID=146911 RepID=A0ABM1KTH3_GEKJA|nr:PREDICTED: histidine triad nucleotide-binding protein 3-like [Gekko japonicus]
MAGEEGGRSGSSPATGPGPDTGAGAGAAGGEAGGGSGYDSKCIFCRITHGEEPGTELLPCEHEDLVCFRDIRPGAPHHYLVVPKIHFGNCKTLKREHIPLVERMMAAGKNILQRNQFTDLNDIRMGFHRPPFCSVDHLHLHVLAPASRLGFVSRMVYRRSSYWFVTAEQLMERLKA